MAHKTLEEWIEEIKDRDKGKAENAIRTIPIFGQQEAQRAVPVLIAELKKPPPVDTSIRVNVAIALGVILGGYGDPNPRDLKDAVAVLRRLLTDQQSIVKMRAAEALVSAAPRLMAENGGCSVSTWPSFSADSSCLAS